MTRTVVAYTDGACSGNPGAGAWAYRLEWPDGGVDEAFGGDLRTTNNREELKAVREALRRIRARIGDDATWRIVIRTDSQGVINWLTRRWKRANLRTQVEVLLALPAPRQPVDHALAVGANAGAGVGDAGVAP